MRSTITSASIVLLSLFMLPPANAVSSVEVDFKNPEKYTDASLDSPGYERGADAYVMKELRSYFQKLGERYLPPDQQLQIEIRNIDLAGRFEPWRPYAYEVRFMREITWPSIDLHYVLKQNGQIVSQEDARVLDQNYLQRPGRASRSDRLYSEKAMLSDWFQREFKGQHQVGVN
ncbi:DUF3016 domain-containing protein [Pseudomonas sp. REP124]|uniref:DUF3016 domain-containing protein n=1 Tax=Pseudomonas sp. REP124 TaxID=2875731 RepID=UPI001CCE2367|nr:DUF3016 domain-containing protein [Pseudomonas sp. REP124]MBZ9784442.1 DUF3016 domain-containing protein [Pseudomonas sp. REP124]